MVFYRDSVTEKSWELLKTLQKNYRFVLIGGWAVWLYAKKLKSKDIDLVVDLPELYKLKADFELFKNERLKKYEFRQAEVSVDVYTEHYSELGVKAEEILKHSLIKEGFLVAEPELLLKLKLYAWQDRGYSPKGRKDWLDIISLFQAKVLEKKLLFKWLTVKERELIKRELKNTIRLPELNLNEHRMAKAKANWLNLC